MQSNERIALKNEAAAKRQRIIDDAETMKRLLSLPEFKRYQELLKNEQENINARLTDKMSFVSQTNEEKIVMVARINQIESDINKPQSLIWQMESLTEVREAIRERTRERQALGNKTGG
jgi:UDP-N-acetylglucosamine transferase subunit ALG13